MNTLASDTFKSSGFNIYILFTTKLYSIKYLVNNHLTNEQYLTYNGNHFLIRCYGNLVTITIAWPMAVFKIPVFTVNLSSSNATAKNYLLLIKLL